MFIIHSQTEAAPVFDDGVGAQEGHDLESQLFAFDIPRVLDCSAFRRFRLFRLFPTVLDSFPDLDLCSYCFRLFPRVLDMTCFIHSAIRHPLRNP